MHLKSNMDRFIAFHYVYQAQRNKHLKSNMDRFIVPNHFSKFPDVLSFKIQYG